MLCTRRFRSKVESNEVTGNLRLSTLSLSPPIPESRESSRDGRGAFAVFRGKLATAIASGPQPWMSNMRAGKIDDHSPFSPSRYFSSPSFILCLILCIIARFHSLVLSRGSGCTSNMKITSGLIEISSISGLNPVRALTLT